MIFVDLDGVLVDFCLGVARALNNYDFLVSYAPHKRLEEITGLPSELFWQKVVSADPDFWANLAPYPWMRELYNSCCELDDVYILTSPENPDPSTASGKVRWLRAQFGKDFNKYIITHHKEFLAQTKGQPNILVDDTESHCGAFKRFGGNAVLFPQPWNGDMNPIYAKDKVDRVLAEVRRLKKRENSRNLAAAAISMITT